MILYDKNGTFLGMGQDELSTLGYEDMEEFKSYFNDFADLFVDHPGYISKFKNFSWIDYILHSGAPNKNVILKQKNGTEIESGLIISEISLIHDINNFPSLYCIELGVANTPLSPQVRPNIKLPNTEEELPVQEMEKTPIPVEPDREIFNSQYDGDFQDSNNTLAQNYDDYKRSETEELAIDNPQEEHIHLKIDDMEEKSQEDDFKLKIDMEDDFKTDSKTDDLVSADENIPKEEKPSSMDDIPIMSQEYQNHIQIDSKMNMDNDNVFEEKITIEDNLKTQDENTDNIQFESIDFMQIAEDTGMDLGDIATFISDFIAESESYIKNLDSSSNYIDMDFVKNEAIKLKSIASNLKMEKISNTLSSIIKNSDENKIENLKKQLEIQVKDLQEQLF